MANITNKPMAYITVNKGRKKIKQGKNVYLENGTEFEIELHNPTQTTVLAKISINNNLISYSGIVLRPGERVFLERYLNNPNKFKFETYNVSGNAEEVKKAIEKNGLIKVEFYNEDIYPTYTHINLTNPTWVTTMNPTWTLGNSGTSGGYVYNTTTTANGNSLTYCSTNDASLSFGSLGDTSTYTLTSGNIVGASASASPTPRPKLRSRSLETGRVEQGSHSSQSFQTVDKKFHHYTTNVVEYQIKPVSQMYVDAKDLKKVGRYCTKCGKKGKPADNFCAGCGNRF